MARRRAGYFTREWRKAKRAMKPNRVGARFISGGRHQTFKAILTSPTRAHTVTTGKNRRTQYQAHKRRQARAVAAERRKAAAAATAQRKAYAKRAAELKKLAPKPPRKPRPKTPPVAVNPHTGKAITWQQAQERAERLAAGLPGDAPAKAARPRAAKTAPPVRTVARPAATRRAQTPRRPGKPRRQPRPIPDPAAAPGKTLTGVYRALTCECQGTGRIVQYKADGTPNGSISCPQHGRKARGQRKFTARRAVTDAGLPGLVSWLDGKTRRGRGNLDKKQRRASGRAGTKLRHAGPTTECGGCDQGIVNRRLTEDLRDRMIAELGAGENPPSLRKRRGAARKACPYDLHKVCGGLGRVPSGKAGDWHEQANLPERHKLTPREKAAGHVDPHLLPKSARTRRR